LAGPKEFVITEFDCISNINFASFTKYLALKYGKPYYLNHNINLRSRVEVIIKSYIQTKEKQLSSDQLTEKTKKKPQKRRISSQIMVNGKNPKLHKCLATF
jgi:hypothetical protein